VADDDEPVVRLADFRPAPPIGDPAYADALHAREGKVHEFTSKRAEEIVAAALAEGVAINHLATSLAVRQRACRHRGMILVDYKSRSLECEDCGADLDLFEVFAGLAERSRTLYHDIVNRDHLARELSNLQARIETAKAEEKRAKSRRRTAAKASEKVDQLGDQERYELNLFRSLYDAQKASDWYEQKRIRGLISALNDARREAEAAARPEPDAPATPPVRLAGGPDG
jgi:hypothetical protein